MKTTGIFTTHYYPIEFESLQEPIYLIPFGDVHKFAPLHSDEHWRDFITWGKTKRRAYFLGMGDYVDLASASERNILKDGKLHESTIMTLEDLYKQHLREFYNDVSFMTDRCVGLLEGNHYAGFQDGTTSTQKLCDLLHCRYLGCSSFIRLSFRHKKHHASIDIWAYHGKGAARLVGGSLNTVQQMGEQAEADIYLMGHDHRKSVGMASKLRLSGNGENLKLLNKKQLYARCGSFLIGYAENKASYITDKNLNPTDLGVIKIELTGTAKQDMNFKVDIHASL